MDPATTHRQLIEFYPRIVMTVTDALTTARESAYIRVPADRDKLHAEPA
jgi:hypothetical protein